MKQVTPADKERLRFLDHVIPEYEKRRRIAQEEFDQLRQQHERDDAGSAEIIDELRSERYDIKKKYKETDT